jgi:cell division protein FtsQ
MQKLFRKYKPEITRAMWVLAIAFATVLVVRAVQFKQNVWVKNVIVDIEEIEGSKNLLEKEDVLKSLKNYLGYSLKKSQIKDLNLIEIEDLLDKDSKIFKSQIYVDGQDILRILIRQRRPILRIIDKKGMSYYLDEEGIRVNPQNNVALRVPVATGYIPDYDKNYKKKKYHVLKNLYQLATALHEDSFLNSLIEQIHVNAGEDMVMIPKIGNEKIVFGSPNDIEEKLENLKLFYKEGLTREGWGKYSHINLEIQGQVYATLRNP